MRRMTVLVGLVAVLAVGCAGPELMATETPAPAHTPVPPSLSPTSTPTPLPTPSPTPTPQIWEVSLGGEFTEEERALAEAQKNQAREFVYRKAKELRIEASFFTILNVRNEKGVFTYIQSPQRERDQGKEADVWYVLTKDGFVKPPLTAPSWKEAVREWNGEELRIEYVDNYEVRRAYFDPEEVKVKDIVSLRNLADKRGFKIGTAVRPELLTDSRYKEMVNQEFNILTPEGGTRIPWRSRQAPYDFSLVDPVINFAERIGAEVQLSTPVWHQSLPEWLTEGDFTRDELIEILQESVTTVVGRYRGRAGSVIVVNEPTWGKMEPHLGGFWAEKIGPEYVEIALYSARKAAGRETKLFINEGDGVEAIGPWSEANYGRRSEFFYNLVKGLVEKGVPIDGVGLQMHISLDKYPPSEEVSTMIRRLGNLGLEVHITEMDVQIGHGPPYTSEELQKQAQTYRDMLEVCLDAPNCTAFTTWGFTDRYTWIRDWLGKEDAPLLFDENYQPKPAYNALVKVLSGR